MVHLGNQNYMTKTRKILDFVNVMSRQPVVTDISGLHIITIFRFKHQEDCLTCSFETSVIVCQLTWQNNTKNFNFHQQWLENLISCNGDNAT